MEPIRSAILKTLAYSDIFEYPLQLEEVHRYLPMPAESADLVLALSSMDQVEARDGYYYLKGRDNLVLTRMRRMAASVPTFSLALFFGRILGGMPFVRMVGITGSLAVRNISTGADMDYMLVTQPGRLWTARAFAVTFGRVMRLFGKRICVNLLVTQNALSWPVHDLYSAHEMCQMIPLTGPEVYQNLRAENPWTESWLPNSNPNGRVEAEYLQKTAALIQYLLELPFDSRCGDRIEAWCMKFQILRLGDPSGNDEVNFTKDVCQGNFHSHRKWAGESYLGRLKSLGIFDDLSSGGIESR